MPRRATRQPGTAGASTRGRTPGSPGTKAWRSPQSAQADLRERLSECLGRPGVHRRVDGGGQENKGQQGIWKVAPCGEGRQDVCSVRHGGARYPESGDLALVPPEGTQRTRSEHRVPRAERSGEYLSLRTGSCLSPDPGGPRAPRSENQAKAEYDSTHGEASGCGFGRHRRLSLTRRSADTRDCLLMQEPAACHGPVPVS